MDVSDAWGQLVCTTDTDTPAMHITKDRFSIGRSSTCDISLQDNKMVSGCHCYLQKDDSGNVWLYDNSTNGTLLNMIEKLTKGECRKLSHGDEFYVVFKKNKESLNVGYVYQDMAELGKEVEETLDTTSDLDATLQDDDLNVATTAKRKMKEDPMSDEKLSVKRLKSYPDSTASLKVYDDDEYSGNTVSLESTSAPPGGEIEKEKSQPEAENTVKNEENTKKVDNAEMEPEKVGSCEVGNSNTKGKKEESKKDEIAETLMCVICQEILHDCISIQPCMHTFCSGCYSEWSSQADDCPSCRVKVSRISKNHIVNNLVEAYVKEHPELKRSEEDIKELDSKNKITRDMLYSDLKTNSDSDDCDDSEDYEDSESNLPDAVPMLGPPFLGNVYRPPRTICRQCPGYQGNNAPATAGLGGIFGAAINAVVTLGQQFAGVTPAAPSTSGAATGAGEPQATTSDGGKENDDKQKVMPTPPKFVCRLNQNHILCCCCSQPMPDRRTDHALNADIPGQQCSLCYRSYCHVYWGCQQPTCMGCLGKFRDLNFGKKCLPGLILDNAYESDIFKNYLESKSISVKAVLTTCLEKLDNAVFSCNDQARFRMNSDTILCYPCGLRNFKDLAFQYRSSIPDDQLPAAVTARPICYWGKNCRTQKNKPHHAVRFNHICNQVRTQ